MVTSEFAKSPDERKKVEMLCALEDPPLLRASVALGGAKCHIIRDVTFSAMAVSHFRGD